MRADDLGDVVRVAASAFPGHFEAPACFEERFRLFPEACFILANGNAVSGYLIAYPWPIGSIPPLNSLLGSLPAGRDAWYLHDLALHADVRGQGHSRPIIDRLVRNARSHGAGAIALVSVNETLAFWRGMGFTEAPNDPQLKRKLESYGDGAAYMTRAT